MQPDIDDFLTYEIKKELADRYFGFRKLIEDDKMILEEKIRDFSMVVEKRICFDLIRIYILLRDEELIHEFVGLAGCEKKIYYDSYLTQSPTIRDRVFQGVKARGITRAGRYKNLLFDCYERLVAGVEEYRTQLEKLREFHETIGAEIELFYRKNDIGCIMDFLRSLEPRAGDLHVRPESGYHEAMERKMRVAEPQPVEQFLPDIPPLTPLPLIRRQLGKLVNRAYKKQKNNPLASIIK